MSSGEAMTTCGWCGKEIEAPADVCENHAMSNAQLGEMTKRIHRAMYDYKVELWGPSSPQKTMPFGR